MKVKPKALSAYIEDVKISHLRFERDMEYWELLIEKAGEKSDVSLARAEMSALRKYIKMARPTVRNYTRQLEKILREDEASNGWKGEERFIELGRGA